MQGQEPYTSRAEHQHDEWCECLDCRPELPWPMCTTHPDIIDREGQVAIVEGVLDRLGYNRK